MGYWVYILQSRQNGRYYCGHTDNLERRFSQHNDPEYLSTRTTKIIEGPWEIVFQKSCENRSEAMILERSIKKRGIRRYLEKRKNNSE